MGVALILGKILAIQFCLVGQWAIVLVENGIAIRYHGEIYGDYWHLEIRG